MKKLNVMNSEKETIYVVVNGNDVQVKPNETVQIQTNASFNSDDFYVDGDCDGNWKAKYNGENVILYINQFHGWSSFKSEDGSSEVAKPL